MSEKIIEINNITVKFNMMKERVDSLKEYMVRFLKGNLAVDAFYALQNISFDIKKGEIIRKIKEEDIVGELLAEIEKM